MNKILFLDIESDPKTRKVSEISLIFGNREYKGADIMKMLPWFREAEYICGHNIIGHDIPVLEEKLGWVFNNKKFIEKSGPRYTLSDLKQYSHSIKMEDAIKPQESIIYVSTMHMAKSKQFDHVFVLLDNCDLRADADARLLYVATTRAKSSLIINNNREIY